MTRGKRNVLLLVGIVGLAALLWFTREQPEPEVPLTALSPDLIDRIRVAHPDRPAIVLARGAEDQWRLTEPVEADADALEVAALLNLANLPVRRQLDGAFDPAELGLAPPAFVITLNDVVLRFGDTNPITAQRVVQTDTLAALVDNPPSAALDDDYTDLVSKQLIPEGDAIVAIDRPTGAVSRRLMTAGAWSAFRRLIRRPWSRAGKACGPCGTPPPRRSRSGHCRR